MSQWILIIALSQVSASGGQWSIQAKFKTSTDCWAAANALTKSEDLKHKVSCEQSKKAPSEKGDRE